MIKWSVLYLLVGSVFIGFMLWYDWRRIPYERSGRRHGVRLWFYVWLIWPIGFIWTLAHLVSYAVKGWKEGGEQLR